MPMEEKKKLLFDRLDKNLADYHKHLMGFSRQEIIDMAARAAAMSDVHRHVKNSYTFNENQLDFLLQFQNPLEIITDVWEIRLADMSDLDFIIYGICKRQDALHQDYARADGNEPATSGNKKPSVLGQLRQNALEVQPPGNNKNPKEPEKG